MNEPKPGEVWRHHNGQEYEVLLITNEHTSRPAQYPVTVVYKNVRIGSIWSRPLHDWHRSMTRKGEGE